MSYSPTFGSEPQNPSCNSYQTAPGRKPLDVKQGQGLLALKRKVDFSQLLFTFFTAITQKETTNAFQRIGFSGPVLLLRRQRGFVLLVHVATELGPISVEFRLLD